MSRADRNRKVYVGDGVYAEFTSYELILTTENGIEVTNTIVLEPSVLDSLIRLVEGDRKERDGHVQG